MAQTQNIAFAVIIVLLLGVVGLQLGSTGTPAGQLVRPGPGECYYKTINGDFIPYISSAFSVNSCTWSGDDNYDPFEWGQIHYNTLSASTYYDSCTEYGGNFTNASDSFIEYSCAGNTLVEQAMGECTCATGSGNQTNQSQCVDSVVLLSTTNISVDSCQEFGDYGYNPYILGHVTAEIISPTITQSEQCGGFGNETNSTLYEYFCGNESAVTTIGTCTLGCNNGECIGSKSVRICNTQLGNIPTPR